MRVYTDIHNLDLRSGLKSAIAQQFPELTAQSIPFSLSFRRQGLGLRSAVLLQWSARQKVDLAQLRLQALERFSTVTHPTDHIEKTWQFDVTIPETGWLEFQLLPSNLTVWLERCSDFLTSPEDQAIACLSLIEPPSFAWQYLQQRCRDLLELAHDFAAQGSPQWQFEDYLIPAWEQTLLDNVARLFLKLLALESGNRHILKTVDLTNIETAFWEFHRHCHLFAYYPAQPQRFWHYCAWLQLLEAIATMYLGITIEQRP